MNGRKAKFIRQTVRYGIVSEGKVVLADMVHAAYGVRTRNFNLHPGAYYYFTPKHAVTKHVVLHPSCLKYHYKKFKKFVKGLGSV